MNQGGSASGSRTTAVHCIRTRGISPFFHHPTKPDGLLCPDGPSSDVSALERSTVFLRQEA